MANPTDYELGSTLGGVATLDSLSIPNPESQFTDSSQIVKLANGTERNLGAPSASWHYGFLSQAQWDSLKTICTGTSTSIFFSTLNNSGDFVRYSGIARLPEQYVLRGPTSDLRYIDITISFTYLVDQST